jgi:NTP pyrophosphatase (non-canonical NTP hydrolase)
VELREAQRLIRDKYFERDSARGVYATFTWLVEEVGEVADSLLKMDMRGLREEVADVFAWLLSLANLLGIDVEEAFMEKYGVRTP